MKRAAFLKGMVAVAAAVVVGCETEDDDTSGGGDGGASASNSGSGASGGNGSGGSGAGSSSGGSGSGGSSAGACMGALMVHGSNYSTDPHDFSIPLADLEAGGTKTYRSNGNGHTHDITLTDADFAALRNGETVYKYTCFTSSSSTDHEWVISCADPNVMPTFEGEIGTPGNCPA